MQKVSRNGSSATSLVSRAKLKKRSQRSRQYAIEKLEERVVMSYTFSYDPVTQVAKAIGDSSTDSLVIENYQGFLYHSVDGGQFIGTWGGSSVAADPAVTVKVNLSSGDGSSLGLGTTPLPASTLLATFQLVAPSNTSDTLTIDDTNGLPGSPTPPYVIDTDALSYNKPSVLGLGIVVKENAASAPFEGGITLLGSSVEGDVYNVVSVQADEPFNIVAGASSDSTVNVGYNDTLSVSSPLAVYAAADPVTLNINDSADTTSTSATLDGNSGNPLAPYEVTGLSAAPIEYGPAVTTLNVYGGTAGINWTVAATQFGTTAYLFTNGTDLVDFSDNGSVASILGDVHVENDSGDYVDIIADASADTIDHQAILAGGVTESVLSGFAPGSIFYRTADVNSVTIDTGPEGYQELALDFTLGNPVPIPVSGDVPGLSFNGGADSSISSPFSHSLVLFGSNTDNPFISETNNASDLFLKQQKYGSSYTPFFGDIQLTDSLASSYYIEYTGLQPITDVVPVENYTFNDDGYLDQSFTAVDAGPYTDFGQDVANGIEFYSTPPSGSTPTFEGTYIANKTAATFNAPALLPIIPQTGLTGLVNIPTASDGLQYLQFNAPTQGTNVVSFVALPDIVDDSGYTGSSGTDDTSVTGAGVPLGTYFYANGAGGVNTLTYDAGGETPTIEPDGLGGVLISIPGFGTVDAYNYQTINIVNAGQAVITPGLARSINTVEGFLNVDAITGTFTATAPVNIIPLPPSDGGTDPAPATLPASDFVATTDWGDLIPSDLDAGSIIQDASDPSLYYVKGTHTYTTNGSYTITDTIGFLGGSYTYANNTLVPGVNVTVSFGGNASTTTLATTAVTVTQGTLAVSAFPLVGTEGLTIGSGGLPVGTFIDAGAGGNGILGIYSADIAIVWPNGTSHDVGAGTITNAGTGTAEFTITAPTGIPGSDIPESGTYKLVVTVTDSAGANPITVQGAALVVAQDATLTPGAATLLTPSTGIGFTGTAVGTFTDADIYNGAGDFTAIIDWGDGTPNSVGTVVGTGGSFSVEGTHKYAKYGVYDTTVTVTEVDGSVVTVLGSATVKDPAITGVGETFTTVQGLPSGQVLLAVITDPNTLATAADITATLTSWGGTATGIPPITVVQTSSVGGSTVFDVFGDVVYSTVGTYTYSLSVSTADPSNPAITVDGTAHVIDATMSSSNGTEITGYEGISTGTVLLGTFTSADPTAPLGDFSAVVSWGGGGTGSTAATITQPGGVGTPFLVFGSYTYFNTGTAAYTVTVSDIGGQSTIISGSAFIADANLNAIGTTPITTTESPIYPVPVFGVPIFTGVVGSFISADPLLLPGDFKATIDWGDGTPESAGVITQPGAPGSVFDVTGSHTYASSGPANYTYPITVYVTQTSDQSSVTLYNTASVAPVPIVVTGSISPSSLSGKAGTLDLTNVTQPTFTGTSAPFSNVTLYAVPVGTSTLLPIGHTEAGSDGSWTIITSALPAGQHSIIATATDQFGLNPSTPVTITPLLTIDTAPPVITNLSFDRFDATLTVTYQDGLGGMNLAAITNSAFYHLSATPLSSKVHVPKLIEPTQIYYTPGATPSSPVTVEVVFNNGRVFRGGKYQVVIDSGNGGTGIDDAAGNALDGNFYGTFPSGDGVAGGNFVTTIYTFHNTILPFVPGDGYSPPPAGIDPPAGTKLPKFHKPVATAHKPAVVVHKTKTAVAHTTTKVATKSTKLSAVDAALVELVAASKSKKS